MLATLRKLLSSSRLHLLPEHGRVQALLSDALHAYGAVAELGTVQCIMPSKSFASGARLSNDDDEETELTLPEDLSVIARLNPQLRDVILAHREHERCSLAAAGPHAPMLACKGHISA
jgi:hypothetical protein